MSEKTCLEATHVWIRYDQDHTPNGVCPLCSCIVKLREVEAERNRLAGTLATWQEHNDTAPHTGCDCIFCHLSTKLARQSSQYVLEIERLLSCLSRYQELFSEIRILVAKLKYLHEHDEKGISSTIQAINKLLDM